MCMEMKSIVLLISTVFIGMAVGQTNYWTKIVPLHNDTLLRTQGCIVYLPDSDRFLISWGYMSSTRPRPYSEQVFSFADSIWKNHFPAGKLGVWGDTTGPARNTPDFTSSGIAMLDNQGNIRPNLTHWDFPNIYYQYAYCPDDKKVYYHIQNRTIRYDPSARVWEVLSPAGDPAGGSGKSQLRMGSLCYDPYNREILLFGGTCVDAPDGAAHTWTYSPAANTWTKLNLSVEPPLRANSPLVYDEVNRQILLFSGDHGDYLLADTWAFDVVTKTWRKKSPPKSPSPRCGHAMVYLPKSGKVVMMGGYTYAQHWDDPLRSTPDYAQLGSFEIWTYDFAADNWKLVKRFSTPAPTCLLKYHSVYAADTADRIVMTGLEGGTPMTYVMRCDPTATDDAGTALYGWTTDSILKRGGQHEVAYFHTEDGSIDSAAQEVFLQNLPPNVLTAVVPPKYAIGYRDYGKAAYSPDHDVIFHWGGGHSAHGYNDVPEYHISKNRWYIGYTPEGAYQYTGSNWGGPPAPLTLNGRPFMQVHAYDMYEYCPVLGKVLFFHDFYTHVYDPVKQDFDSTLIPPAGDMSASESNDYYRSLNNSPHGMVAWTKKTAGSTWGLWILDTPSLAWRTLPVKNGLAVPQTYCEQAGFVYDSRRDRMLFTNVNSKGQMWEYRFSDSTLNMLNPADTQLVRSVQRVREGVYLHAADQVLYQDTVSVGGIAGLSVYDCAENRWKCAPVTCNTGYNWKQSSASLGIIGDKRGLIWRITQHNNLYVLKYEDQSLSLTGELKDTKASDDLLMRVHPNPFNPSALITMRRSPMDGSSKYPLDLRIYDVQGRLLEQQIRPAGTTRFVFSWSAQGRSSGLYYAVIRSGDRAVSLKMILAR